MLYSENNQCIQIFLARGDPCHRAKGMGTNAKVMVFHSTTRKMDSWKLLSQEPIEVTTWLLPYSKQQVPIQQRVLLFKNNKNTKVA